MGEREAIDALSNLGLSSYEAQVFVALQKLGRGTAADVSRSSEVPRSQVYGTADDLAERGLIEIVEATPKAYRPVALSTAREMLTDRLEGSTSRAFENLETLRASQPDSDDGGEVSVLRGRRPITDRIATLIQRADRTTVYVSPSAAATTADVAAALRDAGETGVDVTVVTADRDLEDRFESDPVGVFIMSEDNPADFAGRALLVDDRTVLLAAETENEPVAEEALWSGDSRIGRILAAFMRSGMESGRNRQAE